MAHKEKICYAALATHVEQCFREFTYTPLIIKSDIRWQLEPNAPIGLEEVVNREIDEGLGKDTENGVGVPGDADALALEVIEAVSAWLAKAPNGKLDLSDKVRDAIKANIFSEVSRRDSVQATNARNNFVAGAGEAFDLRYPERVLLSRMDRTISNDKFDSLLDIQFKPLPKLMVRELPHLGLFFTEATCFRVAFN